MKQRPVSITWFSKAPPAFVEYGYYLLIFYAIMGDAFGISVGLVGAGALALLAMYCLWRVGLRALEIYKPSAAILACGALLFAMQLLIHGESLMEPNVRSIVTWMLGIIIVQSLVMRKDFFHRFALVMFLIGLLALPFMQIYAGGIQLQRSGLDRSVGFANPNDLASWFGFSMVYLAVAGMEARDNWVRTVLWSLGVGCLFVVVLTVSRGPLLAAAIATVIALRGLLKRGFVPAVLLVVVVWVVYTFGVFEQGAANYQARLEEHTGRLTVWPLVVERILDHPLTGAGVSNLATPVPFRSTPITPHNGFLYVGLAAGILPLAFFTVYWFQVGRAALKARRLAGRTSAFLLPLAAYAFLITMQLSTPFMTPWMIVTLAAASMVGKGVEHYKLRRVALGSAAGRVGAWVKVGYLASRPAPRRRSRQF